MRDRAALRPGKGLFRVRRHGAGLLGGGAAGAIALGLLAASPSVEAAPVRGKGQAKVSETNKPSLAGTRARALRRARRAALQSALGQVSGPVDGAARKAVLKSTEAWTGAYRILDESSDGAQVRIEIEVEIDLVRLTKRVGKREGGAGRPMFRLGQVGMADACGDAQALSQTVRDELSAQGGVALEGKGPALDVALDCQALGPVEHTYLRAATVRVVATAGGETVVELRTPAFAATPEEAVAAGVQRALSDAALELALHRRGRLRVVVKEPLPSARVRRLEAAMVNSVLGVDRVEVAAVRTGHVELHVRGSLDARTLARRLGKLSLPGMSVSVVKVQSPDALTIRVQ